MCILAKPKKNWKLVLFCSYVQWQKNKKIKFSFFSYVYAGGAQHGVPSQCGRCEDVEGGQVSFEPKDLYCKPVYFFCKNQFTFQGPVQKTCLCKREKEPGHGLIFGLQPLTLMLTLTQLCNFVHLHTNKTCTIEFLPFQNRCRKSSVWWPFSVLIIWRECIFCNIASLQSLYEVIIMSQLVRRQVKPLISSDQVRFYLQFPDIQLKEIIAVGVMNKFSHPLAPLCSSATLQGEARLRVLSLYKAWRRHIPIMCKDFDLPRTEAQCNAALRWEIRKVGSWDSV